MAGIKGITIEFEGNTTKLDKALSGVTKKSNAVGKELKEVDKLLKFSPGNTEAIAQKQKLLGDQVKVTSEKLQGLKGAQAQVEDQFKKGDMGAEQYRAFKREIEMTEVQLQSYKTKLSNIDGEQAKLGQNTKRLETFFAATKTNVSDYSDVLGTHLTNSIKNGTASSDQLELALNKIGKQALGSQSDITQLKSTLDSVDDGNSLDNVKADLNGLKDSADTASESAGKIGELLASQVIADAGKKVAEFGAKAVDAFKEVDAGSDIIIKKTGAIGTAQEELIGIYKDLGSTSVYALEDTGSAIGEVNTQFGFLGDELKENADLMLKFSRVNDSDVTASTINAKAVMESYRIEHENLGAVLDTVTSVAQRTGVGVDEIMNKAIAGAPQIKALGLSFGEGAELIGQMEQKGVDSAAALSSLAKATTVYSKEGKTLKEGLGATIDAIKNTTSETDALNMATEVFGSKGAVRMVDAIKSGRFSLDDLAASSENAAGTLNATFESTLDPVAEQEAAMNALKITMGDVGSEIAVALLPVFQALGEVLKVMSQIFGALPGPVKTFIVIIGLLFVAFTAILPVIGALNIGLGAMGISIGAIMSPVLIVIGVIAAVIAIIALVIAAIKNWGAITDWFKGVWEAFSGWLMGFWNGIKDFMNRIWQMIKDNIDVIIKAIIIAITGPFGLLAILIFDNWETIKNTFFNALGVIQNTVSNIFGGIKDTVSNIFNGIKDTISNTLEGAKNIVSNVVKAIAGFFTGMKLSFPKIQMPPLPHFSIKGDFSLMPPSVPYIGIDWYAKGGIMTQPTIFGANASKLLGGGEAGPEAILPLNKANLSVIGDAIAAHMGHNSTEDSGGLSEVIALLKILVQKETSITLDGREVVKGIGPQVDEYLKNKANIESFGMG